MRTRAGAALEIGAAVLAGAAMVAAYARPLTLDLPGVTLSIRTLARPVLLAGLAMALRLWLVDRGSFARDAAASAARIAAGSLVAASLLGWIAFLSPTCGGADSYGYVSAAGRILDGTLVREEPLAAILPPRAADATAPLGYVPSGRLPHASAPAYPLGLPAVMAIAQAAGGRDAPFAVAPLAGLVLLAAVFLTARAWYRDRQTALLAAALVAAHPLVFTYAIQPMSDVPAAAAFMLAVAGLSATPSRPALAGLAGGLALVIRFAMAPAAVALAIVPVALRGRSGVRSSVRYLVPVLLAAVVHAWTQWLLYGSPTASGYGSMPELFALEHVPANAWSYARWSAIAFGPVWLASAAIGVAVSGRAARVVLAASAAGLAAPYLLYRPYDHWETLRFVLPAVVIATIVAAAGLIEAARRAFGRAWGGAVASLVAVAVASGWMAWLSANGVFEMADREARHRLAGDLVARATPADAVIIALQHSGSLRYYGRRETLNFDRIPAGELDPAVRALQAHGHPVFLMLDSAAERSMFDARHGAVLNRDGWLPSGQVRDIQLYEAPATVSR